MTYVLYARGHRAPDTAPRIYVPVLPDAATAKLWLDHFLGSMPFDRDGNVIKLHTDFDIKLDSPQLDAILATPASAKPLRDDELRLIARFKHGSWDEDHSIETTTDDDGNTVKIRAPKPERVAKASRPDGYLTIGELCVDWDMLPSHARAALRAFGRVKPDYGWAFAPADVPAIKKLCKEAS